MNHNQKTRTNLANLTAPKSDRAYTTALRKSAPTGRTLLCHV